MSITQSELVVALNEAIKSFKDGEFSKFLKYLRLRWQEWAYLGNPELVLRVMEILQHKKDVLPPSELSGFEITEIEELLTIIDDYVDRYLP